MLRIVNKMGRKLFYSTRNSKTNMQLSQLDASRKKIFFLEKIKTKTLEMLVNKRF